MTSVFLPQYLLGLEHLRNNLSRNDYALMQEKIQTATKSLFFSVLYDLKFKKSNFFTVSIIS